MGRCFLPCLFFTEMSFTSHKIQTFKVYKSSVVLVSTRLCCHHHHLVQNGFIDPSHWSTLCLYGFASSGHFQVNGIVHRHASFSGALFCCVWKILLKKQMFVVTPYRGGLLALFFQ